LHLLRKIVHLPTIAVGVGVREPKISQEREQRGATNKHESTRTRWMPKGIPLHVISDQ
jgi:hypothetical protein